MDEQSCSEEGDSADESDIQEEERHLTFDDETEDKFLGYDEKDEAYDDEHDDDDDDHDYDNDDNGYVNDDDDREAGDDDDSSCIKVENNQNLNLQKYVPPHLREQQSSEVQREHLNRIKRQMKGLLNRYVLVQYMKPLLLPKDNLANFSCQLLEVLKLKITQMEE